MKHTVLPLPARCLLPLSPPRQPQLRCRASARVRAWSISSPGPVISNGAKSDKAYDWVTGFEQQTGCQVRVKTAATSDEMVALMAKGL